MLAAIVQPLMAESQTPFTDDEDPTRLRERLAAMQRKLDAARTQLRWHRSRAKSLDLDFELATKVHRTLLPKLSATSESRSMYGTFHLTRSVATTVKSASSTGTPVTLLCVMWLGTAFKGHCSPPASAARCGTGFLKVKRQGTSCTCSIHSFSRTSLKRACF